MASKTRFTVIIPTRERADTLVHALRTVTSQDYDQLDIVVSDNASGDNTADVVRASGDSRVRYVNPGRRVGMSQNFEFALSHVNDGWVTVMGDDDGLLPQALEHVDEVIQESGCQALSSRVCMFIWPGWNKTGDARARLTVPFSKGYEIRSSQKWLRKVMHGEVSYANLPQLYSGGFSSIELINRGRDAKGRFYRSMTPDIYSGVAIAALTDRFAFLRRPVAINGASPHSTGSSYFGGSGHALPAQKFYAEDNIPFHANLGNGKLKALSWLVYEAYLQAAELHGDLLKIRMGPQIALALSSSSKTPGDEAEQYLREVAGRNGLDFDQLGGGPSTSRMDRARQLRDHARTWFSQRTVNGAYGARNVFEASWIAHAIYEEQRIDPLWRAKHLAARLTKKRPV